MPLLSDVVRASIVLNNLPENFCFENLEQLLKALPELLTVEIPTNITNVIVSNVQPLDSQRNAVWFRYSNAGVFMGIYIFSNGTWQIISPRPNGIFWFMGDSRTPEAGYELVSNTNAQALALMGPAAITALEATFIDDPTATFKVYFACTFIGF